jgi:hypothetical protein
MSVTVVSTTVTFGAACAAARSFEMNLPWWNERPSGFLDGFSVMRLSG